MSVSYSEIAIEIIDGIKSVYNEETVLRVIELEAEDCNIVVTIKKEEKDGE